MRPKLLLTNDDGILAPGIRALYEALHEADFADLTLVAPSRERSGSASSITWEVPIELKQVDWDHETPAWSVDGSPADCVKLAESVILKGKPDLIVSGINAGSNAGRNVLYSGTVGAIIEGAFHEIPGIAFSCENGEEPNFHVARKYVAQIVQYLLAHPLPQGSILNVNVPHGVDDEVKGMRWTHQGRGRWRHSPYLHMESQHGQTYYLGGKPEEIEEEPESDIELLRQGYLTAVPLHVHDLTDKQAHNSMQETFESFFTTLSPK